MSNFINQLNPIPYLFGLKGPSGWGSGSTANEIATTYKDHIQGKRAIVTGCSSGIGFETVRALAMNDVIVYMAVRNLDKTKQLVKELENEISNLKIYIMKCDLSSFSSIRTFVKDFKSLNVPLHILINNAGVMGCPLEYTEDGNEMHFGTNHLGHFLLTELLLDLLKSNEPSRIINVASLAHSFCYQGGVQYNDINGKVYYTRHGAYGQSKLCNILHAKELSQRMKDEGKKVSAFSLHPGVIATTNILRHTNGLAPILDGISRPFQKSAQQGAATTVYLATAPNVEHLSGTYWKDCNQIRTLREGITENPEEWERLKKYSKSVTKC